MAGRRECAEGPKGKEASGGNRGKGNVGMVKSEGTSFNGLRKRTIIQPAFVKDTRAPAWRALGGGKGTAGTGVESTLKAVAWMQRWLSKRTIWTQWNLFGNKTCRFGFNMK